MVNFFSECVEQEDRDVITAFLQQTILTLPNKKICHSQFFFLIFTGRENM